MAKESTFKQGYLDSLCGIYSIINADKIVNRSPFDVSQALFNRIIDYLNDKKILRSVIIDGSNQKLIKDLIHKIANDKFPLQITNKRGILTLKEWWTYSKNFLEEKNNRAILLSLGGKVNHLTTVHRISDRRIYILDSSTGEGIINKSQCKIVGYTETDKYIIYPAQCWYLGKE